MRVVEKYGEGLVHFGMEVDEPGLIGLTSGAPHGYTRRRVLLCQNNATSSTNLPLHLLLLLRLYQPSSIPSYPSRTSPLVYAIPPPPQQFLRSEHHDAAPSDKAQSDGFKSQTNLQRTHQRKCAQVATTPGTTPCQRSACGDPAAATERSDTHVKIA